MERECQVKYSQHRHAIEQAARRWRGGRRGDSGRTRSKILISTQVLAERSHAGGGAVPRRAEAARVEGDDASPAPAEPVHERAPVGGAARPAIYEQRRRAAAGRGGVGYVRAVTAHCVRRGRIGPRDGLGCPQRMCGGSMRYREQHFVLSHSVA